MPYDNTQPRPGHLDKPSSNPTKGKQSGDDGTRATNAAKPGAREALSDNYPNTPSGNPTKRGGSEVKGLHARGYRSSAADPKPPEPRDTSGVRSI